MPVGREKLRKYGKRAGYVVLGLVALDLLAGCVLALLVIAGAVAVMALTGRRSVAASSPGPVHSDVGSPDSGARTPVALCVLRV